MKPLPKNNTIECPRCLMDSSCAGFYISSDGNCNFCCDATSSLSKSTGTDIATLLNEIQQSGSNKEYDCIAGISGGVDSCFAIHKAVSLGLRPLVIHFDNGWNSSLATHNIYRIVSSLNLRLITHVVDWNQYRTLLDAFLKSHVIDLELIYDNAMLAVNYRIAQEFSCKYIISGSNKSTESIKTPSNWNWIKSDSTNIAAIARLFDCNIDGFPTFSTIDKIYYKLSGYKWIPLLDYFSYDKKAAFEELHSCYGYLSYPFKHYESIFTRLYQGFILPVKFSVDKRMMHYSALILSNQLDRDEAARLLSDISYPSIDLLRQDISYFLTKMSWSIEDLQSYLLSPPIPHDNYKSSAHLYRLLQRISRHVK